MSNEALVQYRCKTHGVVEDSSMLYMRTLSGRTAVYCMQCIMDFMDKRFEQLEAYVEGEEDA